MAINTDVMFRKYLFVVNSPTFVSRGLTSYTKCHKTILTYQ